MKPKFSQQILKKKKKPQISSFIKIRPVAAELFHAAGQTYRTVHTSSLGHKNQSVIKLYKEINAVTLAAPNETRKYNEWTKCRFCLNPVVHKVATGL